jgi:hypothetical protein
MAAKYILGEYRTIDIKGPKEKVGCIAEVLEASKKLYTLLESEDANIADVIVLASQKNLAAQKYKKLTGENWYF